MKTIEELVRLWAELPPAPRGRGVVRSICVRRGRGLHELPRAVDVSREQGVSGDSWSLARDPERLCQLTIMSASVAALVAHPGTPGHDAGDNFLVDLDLSEAGLPVGARLRLGGVLCVVSSEPHTGCKKFRARFGAGALHWVNHEDNVRLRLRGLNLSVLEDGRVQVGDGVEVLGLT